jgi:hypothetical protein
LREYKTYTSTTTKEFCGKEKNTNCATHFQFWCKSAGMNIQTLCWTHPLTQSPTHPSIHPCMLRNVEKIRQRNNNMHDSLAVWILALFLFYVK